MVILFISRCRSEFLNYRVKSGVYDEPDSVVGSSSVGRSMAEKSLNGYLIIGVASAE